MKYFYSGDLKTVLSIYSSNIEHAIQSIFMRDIPIVHCAYATINSYNLIFYLYALLSEWIYVIINTTM